LLGVPNRLRPPPSVAAGAGMPVTQSGSMARRESNRPAPSVSSSVAVRLRSIRRLPTRSPVLPVLTGCDQEHQQHRLHGRAVDQPHREGRWPRVDAPRGDPDAPNAGMIDRLRQGSSTLSAAYRATPLGALACRSECGRRVEPGREIPWIALDAWEVKSSDGRDERFEGATLYLRAQCGTEIAPWSETQLTRPDGTQSCKFRTSTITFASHKAATISSTQIANAKAFIVIRW